MDIESTEPPAEKVICYCFKRRPKKKPAEEQREISRNHILLLENEKVYLKKDSISVKHSETVYTSSKSLSSFDFRKETYDEKLRIGLKSCLKGDLLKKYSRKMRTHLRLLYVDKDYSRLEWGRTKTRHNSGLFVTDILRVDKVFDSSRFPSGMNLETLFERNKWICIIQWCMDYNSTRGALDLLLLREEWKLYDKDKNGILSFKEIQEMLDNLNIGFEKKALVTYLKDITDKQHLSFKQFILLRKKLTYRTEFEALYRKYSQNLPRMPLKGFVEFLQTEQDMRGVSKPDAELFLSHALAGRIAGAELSFQDFIEFLSSKINFPIRIAHLSAFHDMDMPLTCYYIASSHNTYLQKGQLVGNSSVSMYTQALSQGCRCVELDCWDGKNGEPEIYHGYTLTTRILFKDAVSAIADSAFQVNPYPVILSLENHCSEAQQKRMAKILSAAFSDRIVKRSYTLNLTELPSPNDLKGRVLLKAKTYSDSCSDGLKYAAEGDEDDEDRFAETAPELAELCFFVPKRFCGFDRAGYKVRDVVSMNFSRFKKIASSNKSGMIKLCQSNMFRIYPDGTNINSENFDPAEVWRFGAQIAAMNYQTAGVHMAVNQANFLQNGFSGFIKKPESMIIENPAARELRAAKQKMLTVEVISASNIPKLEREIVDPYVVVELNGTTTFDKFKTNVVNNNGYNPVWNMACRFEVDEMELAFLVFTIFDKDKMSKDDYMVCNALPLREVRKGYYFLPMKGTQMEDVARCGIYLRFSKD